VTTASNAVHATDRPTLTLVTDNAEEPIEGTVVAHQGEDTSRPAWLTAVYDHARDNKLYAPQVGRGYGHLARAWFAGYRDGWTQQIATAKADLKTAKGDSTAEARARELLQQLRSDYRKHRLFYGLKSSGWAATATAGTLVGAATGGLLFDLGLALTALGLGAWNGRPQTTGAQAGIIELGSSSPAIGHGAITADLLPAGAEPFPIAQAQSETQAAMCALLAMRAEGVPAVEIAEMARHPWGWQCTVRVSEGTPEAIIKTAGALETRLDLPANGVRPQPMLERRACAILRLVSGNPFETAPGMPYRAPKSVSISDFFRIGTSVGGDPLDINLAGVMGLWVAASGGGKTGILQALAEGTTACRDNITIDLDPHGDGLEDLFDAVRITARSNEQIEAVLLFFLVMSKARARLRKKLGMGKKWIASPEHPAITIFFDEFPKASELAKRLAFDLLLVGRKELIQVEIASQGGTKLYLGENFAQMVALKGVGPCKVGDTRAVFGDDSVREGWLPHRLAPATQTDSKDAGHIYLQGVPGKPDEPIEYAIHETPATVLRQLAAERLAAGLLDPDQISLDAMAHVDLPEYVEPQYDNDGNIKKEAPVELLTWSQLLRLCEARPSDASATGTQAEVTAADAADLYRKRGVDRMRTETLLAALAEHDPGAYGHLTTEQLKGLLKEAGAGSPVQLGALDGDKNPRGYKLDALTSLR
jgi:S-DNA-T family DNA segregation ATPase FtsK/SpoIIIE